MSAIELFSTALREDKLHNVFVKYMINVFLCYWILVKLMCSKLGK